MGKKWVGEKSFETLPGPKKQQKRFFGGKNQLKKNSFTLATALH